MSARITTALFGLLVATTAHAIPSEPNGLVLKGASSGWGYNCPNASGVAQEFNVQGFPLTIVNASGWPTVNLDDYSMIFLEDCQELGIIQAWDSRKSDLEDWVRKGGFLAVHATTQCGAWPGINPDIPGGKPTFIGDYPGAGNKLVPDHPVLAGLPPSPTGNALAHDSYPSTGNPNDTILLTANTTNNAILFERKIGNGVIIYGGLTYSCYVGGCGGCVGAGAAGDAGIVLRNEVAWGSEFPLCGEADADGDSVGDLCDVCDGGDDLVDTDADGVPNDCDTCPNLAYPDDVDEDGICDDIDDSDGDGIVDLFDVCSQTYDPDQTDFDGDGWGDACDACPMSTQAGPRMIEWFVDLDGDGQGVPGEPTLACTRPFGHADNTLDCDDSNRYIRQGAPEVCDGLDNNCDGIVDFDGCEPGALPTPDVPSPGTDPVTGGCDTAPVGAGWLALWGAALLTRRRRRRR